MRLDVIYNEECLEGLQKVQTESVDVIITDPPYFQGLTHNGQRGDFADLAISAYFFKALFAEFARVLKPTGKFYFFTDWRGYAFYYPLISEYLPVKNMLVWDKISGPGNHYAFMHELVIFGFKGNQSMTGSNIIRCKGVRAIEGEKVHPTQKPLELIEKLITDSTQPGDLVLDCFAGSGTTAVAAKKLGRKYICFELQEKYAQIARQRVENTSKTLTK